VIVFSYINSPLPCFSIAFSLYCKNFDRRISLTRFTERRLGELFDSFQRKTIAVVGDVMLDRYFWGSVNRISPEAPVPIVDVESESARLGGAANVAHNIHSLGGKVLLVGVIGSDSSGDLLVNIMKGNEFSTDGVIRDEKRATTVKTRIIAHHQHVVRIDRETRADISESVVNHIVDFLRNNINSIDAIIIEDYNKGVVTSMLIHQLIALANQFKKIITADPKFNNFFEYKNVTLFKPNTIEVEKALNRKVDTDESVLAAGKELIQRLQTESVLITRGEQGMMLFERNGDTTHVSARARKVADVSGAGDTVISTLTMALAVGANPKEACTLANFAGGVVCGEVGVIPIEREALKQAVLKDTNHWPSHGAH
jgi:rfaE bifunctional protein kinase chain/domain